MNRRLRPIQLAPFHRSSKRPTARCGYSLIEVLLAVSILSMVMTAVAVAMQAMYRVDRQLKDNSAYELVVPRLSLQLRTDVHSATHAALREETPNEPAGVALTLAGGEVIDYESHKGRVVRDWRRGQEQLGREVYALGDATTFRWQTSESPSPMVELEIVRFMGKIKSEDSRQVDRVRAAIGIRNPRDAKGAGDESNE